MWAGFVAEIRINVTAVGFDIWVVAQNERGRGV
jgi:hypothetical protein